MDSVEQWRTFWADKGCPLHRENSSAHYGQYGAELSVLWHGRHIAKVLEIGCGDGSLYEPLGFDRYLYRGIDFSPSMLQRFRVRYPQIELVECNGVSYSDPESYDLIFSNGVLQYFDSQAVELHFATARKMLATGGVLVAASVPWKRLRFDFRGGLFRGRTAWRWSQWLRACASSTLRGDRMGRWYSLGDVVRPARKHGFHCSLYGSMLYPYRFHAVLGLQ